MTLPADWTDAELDRWQERAAIMQHCGGMSRVEAEQRARADVEALRQEAAAAAVRGQQMTLGE